MKRIGCLLLAFQLTGGAALAAAPPPSSPTVQIQTVTHDARTPLTAGRHLTVRLVGTPGGVARFHIAGVAAGIGMRELRSGGANARTATYVGTYVVRPGDAAAVAAITATLKVGGQEAVRASDRPVVIDARPPRVSHLVPQAEVVLENLRPNVLLRFHDGESAVDPASVRLVINGQDVTGKTVVTDAFAAFTPAAPFSPGPVRVEATVADVAGNTTRVAWAFEVARARGAIQSVTVSPAAALKPGDSLTVVMIGAPGGRASFTAAGSTRRIPMRESPRAPGTYFGSYAIGFKDQGRLIRVSTELRHRTRTSTTEAVAAVPVLGPTPRPTITPTASPLIVGEDGVGRVTVQGSSAHGLRVMALVSARSAASARGGSWTPIVAGSTPVNGTGRWRLSLGPFVASPRAALFLTVVAIDPVDQRSPPLIVALAEPPSVAREPAEVAEGEATAAVEEPAVVQPPPPLPPAPGPLRVTATASASCSSGNGNGGSGSCGAARPDQEYTGTGPQPRAAANPSAPAPNEPQPDPKERERKERERKERERKEREEREEGEKSEGKEEQERRKKGKDDD